MKSVFQHHHHGFVSDDNAIKATQHREGDESAVSNKLLFPNVSKEANDSSNAWIFAHQEKSKCASEYNREEQDQNVETIFDGFEDKQQTNNARMENQCFVNYKELPRKELQEMKSGIDNNVLQEKEEQEYHHNCDVNDINMTTKKSIKADMWRFAVLPIFCLLSVTNAMQWITFSPIVYEVRDVFNMTPNQINYLATIYVIAYVLIVFLSCKLYEITGIKMGLLIAASTNMTGATLKIIALYVYPHAALLFIAQAFNSMTEVLTIATPPLISNRWFPEKERTVANTVMSVALNFGCGIGVLFPTFFVGPSHHSKRHFGHLFWFHFGLSAFALLLMIFVFPKKPRTSASYAAACQQSKEEARLKSFNHLVHSRNEKNEMESKDLEQCPSEMEQKKLEAQREPCDNDHHTQSHEDITAANNPVDNESINMNGENNDDDEAEVIKVNIFSVLVDCYREGRHNLSFLLLSLTSAAELGLIWAFATILPQALSPYGVSEATAGWIGFLNLVLGTIVCPFFMPFVERYGRRYKQILCTMAVILVLDMVALTLLLHYGPDATNDKNRKYYAVITFVLWGGVAGLCQNFMMPLMFEYVVELTFPMAESTSAPVLTWTACLTNFVLALGFGAVLTDNPNENRSLRVFIGATVVTAVGAVAMFLTKPLHKRTDYELAMKGEHQRLLDNCEEADLDVACNVSNECNKVELEFKSLVSGF